MLKLKQQKSPEENVSVTLENTAKFLNIKVSKTSLEAVQYLPDFPSLSTLSIALNNLGIETMAVKLEPEQLLTLEYPLIAHLSKHGGHFVLVTDVSKEQITYHDPQTGWVTESFEKFLSSWTKASLLFASNDKSCEVDYIINRKKEILQHWRKAAGIGLGAAIILSSLFSFSLGWELIIAVVFLIGAMLSILLVTADLGGKLIERFCKAGKNVDCSAVLNSPAATLFGWLKMSDMGLVWFTGSWLAIWFGNLNGQLVQTLSGLALLNAVAVIYVPFSVGYQWLKLKQWCSLCVGIQIMLLVNFFLLIPYLNDFTILFTHHRALYSLYLGFLIAVFSWIWIKPLIIETLYIPGLKKDLYKFKTDVSLFSKLLEQSEPIQVFEQAQEIRHGNENAPLQLVIATNPYCKACVEAHIKFAYVVEQLEEKVSIIIRFSTDLNSLNDQSTIVARHLLSLPKSERNRALKEWYQIVDYQKWSALYPTLILPETEAILREHVIWCNWVGLKRTPTFFINGREVSHIYTPDDIIFHIRQMKVDTVMTN